MASEINRIRQQIEAEEESAKMALFGPASVAKHDAIINRMRQGAQTLVKLFKDGWDEEAYALWDAGILGGGVSSTKDLLSGERQ